MVGMFPFISMFLVTSIAMLRERTTGTLEWLMTMPLAKLDLLADYGIAFARLAVVQALITSAVAFLLLGFESAGAPGLIIGLAILDAVLGSSLGLLASAFAATEFQAVQFMPAFILPQVLLCGLLIPRDQMAAGLQAIADVAAVVRLRRAARRVDRRRRPRRRGDRGARAGGNGPGGDRAGRADATPPDCLDE
jgi:ABC-2 type transport system permease protein